MITIGIDQSITSTGLVAYSADVGEVVAFERICTNKSDDVITRCLAIADAIIAFIECHNGDVVVMEQLAFGAFGKATRDLAGLRFIVLADLKRKLPHVLIRDVAPTSLKKLATGSGKADKAAMIASLPADVSALFVTAGFKKTTGLSDLADAYWLASTYK